MQPEEPSLFSISQRRWAVVGADRAEIGDDEKEKPPGEGNKTGTSVELELFQGAAVADGYERWKAEAVQARAEAVAARRAEELPAQTDGAGYAVWKSEADAAKRAFEQRWGVPLGKAVRVRLLGEALEREGRLSLVEEPARGPSLRLRLGAIVFEAHRIESVVRVD